MTKYEAIIFWSEEDRAFIAAVPELPGCMADGASRETALNRVNVVIDEWIETAKSLGRPIPQPKDRNTKMRLVQKKVEDCLKHPVRVLPTLPRTDYSAVLRIWHSSSFLANKSSFIYPPSGVNRRRYDAAVVEICWEASGDATGLADPSQRLKSELGVEPTLRMRSAPFDLSQHSSLLEIRNTIGLALRPKHYSVGADGEVWGFEKFDHFEESRFQWWGKGPSDWQPSIKTFHDLLAAVHKEVEANDYQPYQPELHVKPRKEAITE
jgi:predicted RNase H-like HicB family nuclease